MMTRIAVAVTVVGALVGAGIAQANELVITDTHMCCPNCKANITKILTMDGVTGLTVNMSERTVRLQAKDENVAAAAIKKFLQAGYYGKATFVGQPVPLPISEVKSAPADEVKIIGLPIVCSKCVDAIRDAAQTVQGVGVVNANQFTGTIYIRGTSFDEGKVIQALRDAGFAAEIHLSR